MAAEAGFNIVIELDMPVFGIMANLDAGGGHGVTAIARSADGTELDRAAAASTPYPTLGGFLSVRSATPIASVEWWPGDVRASVRLDNVYLVLAPVRADFDGDGDVDRFDLDHLLACRAGPEVRQTDPACFDARLDDDEDVDQVDFGLLQCCLSGEDTSADPACAGP